MKQAEQRTQESSSMTQGISALAVTAVSIIYFVAIFSSSPMHFIVQPDSANETFTFPSGISESIKTFSIKNVGADITTLDIVAEGNNIEDMKSLINQFRNGIEKIKTDLSDMEKTNIIDANNNSTIRTAISNLCANITYLDSDTSNLTSIFKNISVDIEKINNTISSMDKNLSIHRDLITLDSIKSRIMHDGPIFVSSKYSTQIKSGTTGFVSMKIDPSLAKINGQYKGALIIKANDKTKSIPLSFEIKGITSKSTETKAKENKSVTFKSVTLNLTGSLSS